MSTKLFIAPPSSSLINKTLQNSFPVEKGGMGRGKKNRGMRGNRGKVAVRRDGMREGKGGEG